MELNADNTLSIALKNQAKCLKEQERQLADLEKRTAELGLIVMQKHIFVDNLRRLVEQAESERNSTQNFESANKI
jgi:citrate lyase synthetase